MRAAVHLFLQDCCSGRHVLVSDHVVFTRPALDSFVARSKGKEGQA